MPRVTLRYWGALRAAAAQAEQVVEAETVDNALSLARQAHAGSPDFAKVLQLCSLLVNEVPVRRHDGRTFVLSDDSVIDLLPPFAGG